MKKLYLTLLLCFCFLMGGVGLSTLVGCGNGNNNNIDAYGIKTNLDKKSTNIVGADNLAIVKKSTIASQNHSVTTATSNANESDSLVLAKTEGENLEEVLIQDDYSQYTIKQGDLNAEIYKMKGINGFTIVSYISSNIRQNLQTKTISGMAGEYLTIFDLDVKKIYSDTHDGLTIITSNYNYANIFDRTKGAHYQFDETDYFACQFTQNYAICNATGKMYSLSQLKSFDIKGDCLYDKLSQTFFSLSIDSNDNLILSDILPNKDIRTWDVNSDKYGWKYVYNSDLEQKNEATKTIYYSNQKKYAFDDAKHAILLDPISETPLKTMVNGQEEPLGNNSFYNLFFPGYGQDMNTPAIINGFCATNLYSGNVLPTDSNLLFAYDMNEDLSIYLDDTQDSPASYFWLKDNYDWIVKKDQNNNIYCAKIDWNTLRENVQDYAIGSKKIDVDFGEPIFTSCTYSYSYALVNSQEEHLDIFSVMGLNGTENYSLVYNQVTDELEPSLLSSREFATSYYVIQPLN